MKTLTNYLKLTLKSTLPKVATLAMSCCTALLYGCGEYRLPANVVVAKDQEGAQLLGSLSSHELDALVRLLKTGGLADILMRKDLAGLAPLIQESVALVGLAKKEDRLNKILENPTLERLEKHPTLFKLAGDGGAKNITDYTQELGELAGQVAQLRAMVTAGVHNFTPKEVTDLKDLANGRRFGGNIHIGGNLVVDGSITGTGPMTLNGGLNSTGQNNFGNLTVLAGNTITFSSPVTFGNNATFGAGITVGPNQHIAMSGNGEIQNAAGIRLGGGQHLILQGAGEIQNPGGTIILGGNTQITGTLDTVGNTTLSTLSTTGAATLDSLTVNGTITGGGLVTLNGGLTSLGANTFGQLIVPVGNAITFSSPVTFGNNATFNEGITIAQHKHIVMSGNGEIQNLTGIRLGGGQHLILQGAGEIRNSIGTIILGGNTRITGTLDTTGNTTLATLSTSGLATLHSLRVTGASTFDALTTHSEGIKIADGENLTMGGVGTITNTVGTVKFAAIEVTGNSSFNGTLQVTGRSTFTDRTKHNGGITVGNGSHLYIRGAGNFVHEGTGAFNFNSPGGFNVSTGLAKLHSLEVTNASTFKVLSTHEGGITISNNGNFTQNGTGSFTTGSGGTTINGNFKIADNYNFSMGGTGTFTMAGTGAFTLGSTGPVTIAGATTINKNLTVTALGAEVSFNKLTVGNATTLDGDGIKILGDKKINFGTAGCLSNNADHLTHENTQNKFWLKAGFQSDSNSFVKKNLTMEDGNSKIILKNQATLELQVGSKFTSDANITFNGETTFANDVSITNGKTLNLGTGTITGADNSFGKKLGTLMNMHSSVATWLGGFKDIGTNTNESYKLQQLSLMDGTTAAWLGGDGFGNYLTVGKQAYRLHTLLNLPGSTFAKNNNNNTIILNV